MSSPLISRFNEPNIGGTVEFAAPSTYTVTQGAWNVFTTSSADADSARSYWWFDTSWLPDTATITSIQFKARYSSVTTDAGFTAMLYYIQNNTLGTTLDSTDFDIANFGGYFLGQDLAPVAGTFFDSGIITDASALSQISLTAYTNVIGIMQASGPTSSLIQYSAPSAWRSASDVVPRLVVNYTFDVTHFSVSIPANISVPANVAVPTKIATPTYIQNV